MAELSDLKKKYGTGNLTPEQMMYMESLRPQSGSEVAQRIMRESSPELAPDPNILQRMATGAGQAADLFNKYAPKAYEKIPKKVTSLAPFGFVGLNPGFQDLLAQSRKDVINTEVPSSIKFIPSIDTATGEMQPAGFGEDRVKIGNVMEAIKPADLIGLTSAQKVYSDLGYGQAPEPMDVLDTLGVHGGLYGLGKAGLRGASSVARAGAPYVAEGLTDLVSKYGVDPRMNVVPEGPSMSGAVPEGFKLGQENGKYVLFDASGKIFSKGDDAQSAIFRANKRLENEAANAVRAASRVEVEDVKVPADELGFYSATEKAAANLKRNSGTGEVFLSDIRKFPDVTTDELQMTGLEEWLKGRENVTKEQIQQYLNENKLKLEEVEYQGGVGDTSDLRFYDGEIIDDYDYMDSRAEDLHSSLSDDKYVRKDIEDEISESHTPEEIEELKADGRYDEMFNDKLWDIAQDEAHKEYYENPYRRWTNDMGYTIYGNDDVGYSIQTPNGADITPRRGAYDFETAVGRVMDDAIESGRFDEGNTKYHDYQLEGGQNYRELLIKTGEDKKSYDRNRRFEQIADEMYEIGSRSTIASPEQLAADKKRYAELSDERSALYKEHDDAREKNYVGSHWDEPNVIAHVRLQDRVDANGNKVLYVDEMQSDWHQEGSDFGYKTQDYNMRLQDLNRKRDEVKYEKAVLQDQYNILLDRYRKETGQPESGKVDRAAFEAAYPEAIEMQKKSTELFNQMSDFTEEISSLRNVVPEGPYKDDWHELALKRVMSYAAKNGYDRVAFSASRPQVQRWGTESIAFEKSPMGGDTPVWRVSSTEQRGGMAGQIDLEAEARARGLLRQVEPKIVENRDQLREIVANTGRRWTKKKIDRVTNKLWKRMQTEESGIVEPRREGMEEFYDRTLANTLNKYANRYKGKVGDTIIPAGSDKQPAKVIEITPEMKKSLLTGQPMKEGGYVEDVISLVDDYFNSQSKDFRGGGYVAMKEGGTPETKQEFRAVKPAPIIGEISEGLGKASEFLKSRPLKEEGDWKTRGAASAVNSVLELVDSFFVNDLAKTAERMSYGQRLTSGQGETLRVLPETVGAALTLAPPAAKLAGKTAKVVRKVAPEVAETAAQMAERYAMKPSYAVPPADESKFLPLALPRARRTPQQIDEAAQRVSRQMMGEHVRNPAKLKETQNLAGRSLKESQRVQGLNYTLENTKNLPEPVVIEPKIGDVNVATVGDITVADRELVDINGYPIHSTQQGGPFFGQGKLHLPDDESLWWASEPTSAKNFQNRVTEIAEHYGVDKLTAQHLAMGQTANNFAMHFADANLKAIATYGVPEEGVAAINNIVRKGFSKLKDGERKYFAFPDFPGVENIDEAYKYFRANPEARKFFNERMKKTSVTEPNGLPNGLDIEWAITDPLLRNMEKNLTGRSVGEVYRGAGITDTADHGTYGAGIRGKFMGTSKYPTPMELSYSDAYDYTAARKRPQDVTGTMQKIAPHQVVDQQYLDEIGRYNELIKKYTGKKKGGVVDDDEIPLLPYTGKTLTEEEIADWQRKSKAYEDRQYWKRRGQNSPDENDTPVRLDGRNDSYPMRWKIPQQRDRQMMPEVRDEEIPFKKALRYYQKGGRASKAEKRVKEKMNQMDLTPQEQKIVDYHRNTIEGKAVGMDQHGRPVTVYTTTIPVDERNPRGAHANVPGYVGGKIRSREELQQLFKDEMAQGKWPVYRTGEEAGRRAGQVHSIMDDEIGAAESALRQMKVLNRVFTDEN